MKKEKTKLAHDGYVAIEFEPWAKDKLSHLEKYCNTFNTATHRLPNKRIYIDLFSGPGKCIIKGTNEEIDGSPLLSLNCKIPFTHYFFNDIDSDYVEALKNRTKNYKYNIEYFNHDCNAFVDELLPKIPKNAICFAYIDPFYLSINFNTIEKLTKDRRVDLLIIFHIGQAKRNFFQPNLDMKLFFPPSVDWETFPNEIITGGRINTRRVLDAYERGLIELGYPGQNIKDDVLERTRTNIPLYYLVFASKHSLGKKLYSGVINRKDSLQRKFPFAN